MGEDSGTLEDVVEPYLLQIGFLARTRQGRRLTAAATTNQAYSAGVEPKQSLSADEEDLFIDVPARS